MSHRSKIKNGERVPRGTNPARWDVAQVNFSRRFKKKIRPTEPEKKESTVVENNDRPTAS